MEENIIPTVPYSYLSADGLVVDRQPVRVVSSCELSTYTFPFDVQTCELSFNSYSLRGKYRKRTQTPDVNGSSHR